MLLTFFILSFFQSPATALPAFGSIETTPLPIHLLLPRDAPIDCSCNGASRTTFTILQNCLLTIIACVYSALHPNIPDPKASDWKLAWDSAVLTFYMIFFSEFVIAWAIAQRYGAHSIAQKFNDEFKAKNADIKWTPVHGHYLQMGGFRRADNDHVLYAEEVLRAVQDNKVNLDSLKITKKAIQDHSKGDFVSKGIAILQTLWFVLQCMVRLAQGLVLTELEVATLSFALFNAVVYAAWWHKPLNVRSMTPLTIIDPPPAPPSTKLPTASSFLKDMMPPPLQHLSHGDIGAALKQALKERWHALCTALQGLMKGDVMSRWRSLVYGVGSAEKIGGARGFGRKSRVCSKGVAGYVEARVMLSYGREELYLCAGSKNLGAGSENVGAGSVGVTIGREESRGFRTCGT